MSGSLNKVVLIGNLGKDPDIRFLPDGSKVASFSIATSETWKDKVTGEKKDKTEWHRIAVFNDRIADVIEKYVRKGSKIYIEGQLQTRKWTDAAGAERYTTEVVVSKFKGDLILLDSRRLDAGFDSHGGGMNEHHSSNDLPMDDEIPF